MRNSASDASVPDLKRAPWRRISGSRVICKISGIQKMKPVRGPQTMFSAIERCKLMNICSTNSSYIDLSEELSEERMDLEMEVSEIVN